MKILLLNKNQSVSKLINLSAKKYGYDLKEINDVNDLVEEKYDIVFVDDEFSDTLNIENIEKTFLTDEIVLIASVDTQKSDEYKHILLKPFLPNDFNNMVQMIKDAMQEKSKEELEDNEEVKSIGEISDVGTQEDRLEKSDDDFVKNNSDVDIEKDLIEEDKLNKEHSLEMDTNNDNSDTEDKFAFDKNLEEDRIDEDGLDTEHIDEEIVLDEEVEEQQEPFVLDKDELQEVKELLDEDESTIEDDLKKEEFEDNLSADDNFEKSDQLDDEINLNIDEDSTEEKDKDISKDEKISEDDEKILKESIELETAEEEYDENSLDIDLIEDYKQKNEDFSEDDTIELPEEYIDDHEDKNNLETKEENSQTHKSVTTKEDELDLIDEESLKEVFVENGIKENQSIIEKNIRDENISVKDNEVSIQKKEKSKKKKLKKKKLKKLQKEIAAKLLDIDTLREILDGMEIRIKFYNKNGK